MLQTLMRGMAAIKAGKELRNVATWKNRQAAINAIVTILAFGVYLLRTEFPDLVVSDEELLSIATGIMAVAGIINGYLVYATSKKVGPGEGKNER